MSNRWQATATYTLGGLWSAEGQPLTGVPGGVPREVPFAVAPDLGAEWSLAESDQRHRAVFSGIWQVGRGFQLSGLLYLGAGIRDDSLYGGDRRGLGAGGEARLRPDGTIVPRNVFMQPMENRTDIRLQQRVRLAPRVSLDLIAEAFNLFNRANITLENEESSLDYNDAIAGQFRTMQFGFRLAF
jgi:hypothetical protein